MTTIFNIVFPNAIVRIGKEYSENRKIFNFQGNLRII